MKKYLTPVIILGLVGCGVFVRYQIVAPARAAARDLDAVNGLTVGKTTEAELLGRSAFQTADLKCFQGVCVYSTVRENKLLNVVHLAPRTIFSTTVMVRDGIVIQVYVFMTRKGLLPVTVAQTTKLPTGCAVSPCVKRPLPSARFARDISILFDNESEFRNRMPQMLNVTCLSRLRGCTAVSELMPLAKELNLETVAQ